MDFEHVPVLYSEVIEALNIRPDGIYVDGTVGGGGHSSGICERLSSSGTLIAVDRDTAALKASEARLSKYECTRKFIHANYSDTEAIAEAAGGKVQGILLDLGVSSFQLDNADRGFSYMHDAPMDMRMNEDDILTAYDVVNGYSEKELTGMRHRSDEKVTGTYVTINAFQKGIGTGACGPVTAPEFTYKAEGTYTLQFFIRKGAEPAN